MSSFESTRASTIAEYEHYKGDRFTPEQIVVEEDYTIMAVPFKGVLDMEAIAAPARCLEGPTAYSKSGIWVVKLAILDEDMVPEEDNFVYLSTDGMLELTQEFRQQDPDIKEGYLLSYKEGIGNTLDSLLESAGRH